jgi:hypothetical protein
MNIYATFILAIQHTDFEADLPNIGMDFMNAVYQNYDSVGNALESIGNKFLCP